MPPSDLPRFTPDDRTERAATRRYGGGVDGGSGAASASSSSSSSYAAGGVGPTAPPPARVANTTRLRAEDVAPQREQVHLEPELNYRDTARGDCAEGDEELEEEFNELVTALNDNEVVFAQNGAGVSGGDASSLSAAATTATHGRQQLQDVWGGALADINALDEYDAGRTVDGMHVQPGLERLNREQRYCLGTFIVAMIAEKEIESLAFMKALKAHEAKRRERSAKRDKHRQRHNGEKEPSLPQQSESSPGEMPDKQSQQQQQQQQQQSKSSKKRSVLGMSWLKKSISSSSSSSSSSTRSSSASSSASASSPPAASAGRDAKDSDGTAFAGPTNAGDSSDFCGEDSSTAAAAAADLDVNRALDDAELADAAEPAVADPEVRERRRMDAHASIPDTTFEERYTHLLVTGLGLAESQSDAILHLLTECVEGNVPAGQRHSIVHSTVDLIGEPATRFHALQALLTLSVSPGAYDARSRVFLRRASHEMDVPWRQLATVELAVAAMMAAGESGDDGSGGGSGGGGGGGGGGAAEAARTRQRQHDASFRDFSDEAYAERAEKRYKKKSRRRALKIAAMTVGGGAAFGVAGAFAAPLLLPALVGIGLSGAGTLAATGTLASGAVVGGFFGSVGAGYVGNKARKRTRMKLADFDLEPLGVEQASEYESSPQHEVHKTAAHAERPPMEANDDMRDEIERLLRDEQPATGAGGSGDSDARAGGHGHENEAENEAEDEAEDENETEKEDTTETVTKTDGGDSDDTTQGDAQAASDIGANASAYDNAHPDETKLTETNSASSSTSTASSRSSQSSHSSESSKSSWLSYIPGVSSKSTDAGHSAATSRRYATASDASARSGFRVAPTAALPGVETAKVNAPAVQQQQRQSKQTQEQPTAATETHGLHVTVFVPGWLSKSRGEGACASQFYHALGNGRLLQCTERFALRWEPEELYGMGRAFVNFWTSKAATSATQQAVPYLLQGMSLAAGAVLSAVAWPLTIYSAADVVDGPWSVLLNRANAAGDALADVLALREHGQRPVTLVGYSHGARVVFKCLEALADAGVYGVVDDAFIVGAPCTGDTRRWENASKAVAGRLVNAYCGTDWALALFHRGSSGQMRVAGLSRVRGCSRVENVNLALLGLQGHQNLREAMPRILTALGVESGRLSFPPIRPSEVHLLQETEAIAESDSTAGGGGARHDQRKAQRDDSGERGSGVRAGADRSSRRRSRKRDGRGGHAHATGYQWDRDKYTSENSFDTEARDGLLGGNAATDGSVNDGEFGMRKDKSEREARADGGGGGGDTEDDSNAGAAVESPASSDDDTRAASEPLPNVDDLLSFTGPSSSADGTGGGHIRIDGSDGDGGRTDHDNSDEAAVAALSKPNRYRFWRRRQADTGDGGWNDFYSVPPSASAAGNALVHSLGLETGGGYFLRVVDAGTQYPCERTALLTTCADRQESISLLVYQGERRRLRPLGAKDAHRDHRLLKIVEFTGFVNQTTRAGSARIEVAFTLDAEGSLEVNVRDVRSARNVSAHVPAQRLVREARVFNTDEEAAVQQQQHQRERKKKDKWFRRSSAGGDSSGGSARVVSSRGSGGGDGGDGGCPNAEDGEDRGNGDSAPGSDTAASNTTSVHAETIDDGSGDALAHQRSSDRAAGRTAAYIDPEDERVL